MPFNTDFIKPRLHFHPLTSPLSLSFPPPFLSRSLLLSKILYFSFQRAQLSGLSLLFIGPEQPLLGESQLFEPTRSLTTFSSNFLFLLERR